MQLFRTPIRHTVPSHDGLSLNVWDYGGEGPPLLCAHCTGTLGRVWDPVVAALGDQFRVLVPDTRGQGDSASPADRDGYRWDLSGRDLHAVIGHLGLPPGLGAVGHSAGGAHVAHAEHQAPGTFGRIMLIDAIIADRSYFEGENALAAKVSRRINTFQSLAAARERLAGKPPMEHWVTEAAEAYLKHAFATDSEGAVHLKCPGHREAWYYELGGASDLFDDLGTLTLPVCLVTGANSYAQHWVAEQHERLPNSRVEVVADAGHFIPQEQPVAVAELMKGFFRY